MFDSNSVLSLIDVRIRDAAESDTSLKARSLLTLPAGDLPIAGKPDLPPGLTRETPPVSGVSDPHIAIFQKLFKNGAGTKLKALIRKARSLLTLPAGDLPIAGEPDLPPGQTCEETLVSSVSAPQISYANSSLKRGGNAAEGVDKQSQKPPYLTCRRLTHRRRTGLTTRPTCEKMPAGRVPAPLKTLPETVRFF